MGAKTFFIEVKHLYKIIVCHMNICNSIIHILFSQYRFETGCDFRFKFF